MLQFNATGAIDSLLTTSGTVLKHFKCFEATRSGTNNCIDRDIKINYCNNVLNNIVAILVAANDYFA